MVAINKYKFGHSSKATFNTYCHNWIRAYCYAFMKANSSEIRLPDRLWKLDEYKYNFISQDDTEIHINYKNALKEEIEAFDNPVDQQLFME